MLVVAERGALAGRADRAQARRAGRDLKLDLRPQRVVVDAPSRNGVVIATDSPANASPLVVIVGSREKN